MFGFFKKKDEKEVLQKQYAKLLEEARDIQRKGDMKSFALKTAEAEEVMEKIIELQKQEEKTRNN